MQPPADAHDRVKLSCDEIRLVIIRYLAINPSTDFELHRQFEAAGYKIKLSTVGTRRGELGPTRPRHAGRGAT